MNVSTSEQTIGFAQEIPGGSVFEIGNAFIQRRIHVINGRVGTTSLVNVTSGEEYLEETEAELEITISGEGQSIVLDNKDFVFGGYETPNWNDEIRTLRLLLEAQINEVPFRVAAVYEVRAQDDFMRKWIEIMPCNLGNFTVRNVTIEKLKLREMVEGVVPLSRYPHTYDNHEDRVHSEPDKANTAEPDVRFEFGDTARSMVSYWGCDEGLYFFSENLLGEEVYHRPTALVLKQRDYAPLAEGMTAGPAVIGAYSGPPEIGFKRYTQHLMNNWCIINGKQTPVSWSTWLITLEGNKALYGNYDRLFLLEYINYIKEAGFYDILHLDLGWESDYPLRVDANKFPNGMSEVARKAKEAGLDMTYWVNPFSASYWKSKFEDEHPEWLVPNEVSGRSGATAICPLTDYYDYVKQRFIALATEMNARVIYWDGNDWRIRDCSSPHHGHKDQEELEVKAWKRLAEMCAATHDARPDLMFVVFSIPFDNHRLNVLDQEQISDTYSYETVQSELIQRQQLYQMTWEHPYKAIWGSWYGINWHNAGDANLFDRPIGQLIHAEMSMIGNGIAQAGGGFDFKQAPAQFMDFLKKLFAFRKRFENYFDTYQHVLGFPNGKRVDGEGHMVDGKGFVVLINPTSEMQEVKIPLNEPELELSAKKKHSLTNWSNLVEGIPMESTTIDRAPTIELMPLEVKYIGVNVD